MRESFSVHLVQRHGHSWFWYQMSDHYFIGIVGNIYRTHDFLETYSRVVPLQDLTKTTACAGVFIKTLLFPGGSVVLIEQVCFVVLINAPGFHNITSILFAIQFGVYFRGPYQHPVFIFVRAIHRHYGINCS